MASLLIQRDGPIGTIAFSNVDKYNAMTADMWRALPLRVGSLFVAEKLTLLVPSPMVMEVLALTAPIATDPPEPASMFILPEAAVWRVMAVAELPP